MLDQSIWGRCGAEDKIFGMPSRQHYRGVASGICGVSSKSALAIMGDGIAEKPRCLSSHGDIYLPVGSRVREGADNAHGDI
jgi:hypothetical protein